METVDEIRENLACPGCEYNLRGLRGALVACPECGRLCDVVEMVARRWTQPWFNAPGLSTLFGPVAWASIMGIFVMPFVLFAPLAASTRMAAMLVMFVVWLVLMWRAWAVFRGGEGVTLALFAHVILVGYVATVLGLAFAVLLVLGSVIRALTGRVGPVLEPWPLVISLFGGIVLALGTYVMLTVFRRGERYIAQRCIHQYLNRPPRS